jgi:hypothetical protein
MTPLANFSLAECDFGDERLTKRAIKIGEALSLKYGQPLSQVFGNASDLKRTYEFLTNPKTSFEKVIQPNHRKTAEQISELPIVLAVGDTTYLDYNSIVSKREEYGPIGNGGNGLILHSALAINPENGQPWGLLWEKLWHREHKQNKETQLQTAAKARKKRKTAKISEKESYRWVEAFDQVGSLFPPENAIQPRIIHVFDREGDISEVLEKATMTPNTGVVVRAAQNRALSETDNYLWSEVTSSEVKFTMEIELPKTKKRAARKALLEVRYCPLKIRSPQRLKISEYFEIYAVHAVEINAPIDGEPVEWMLLTTEEVTTEIEARTILRWYTYRWRIEEYHQILKSGCNAESYRLGGRSMAVLLGFLTSIAAKLLKMTYLNRTEPETSAEQVLNPLEIEVLKALGGKKLPGKLTVSWAMESVARLGGYLQHRKKSKIGITVLWRGWLELHQLCTGWELYRNHN